MKNPLTPAGIKPATYRFVAQHPNHCATAVPVHQMDLGLFIHLFIYLFIHLFIYLFIHLSVYLFIYSLIN